MLFSSRVGVRIGVRVRIRFSVWLVSRYANAFVLVSIVIVTLLPNSRMSIGNEASVRHPRQR